MWEISNYNQTISFFLSMCVGGIFCAIYDVIRALRKVCLNSFIAVNITDIVLWVFYAFVTFIFLISRTNGEIRGFVLFGELCGFVLFRMSMSKLWYPFLRLIFFKIDLISKRITGVFYLLFAKIESFLSKHIKHILKISKSVKKLLKNALKLLYTKTNIVSTEKSLNEAKTET